MPDLPIAPVWGSEDHNRILQHALSRVTNAEALHNELVPVWKDNYAAFRAMPTRRTPVKKKDWQSDHRSPYVAEQVLTILPRLVETRPRWNVIPETPMVPRHAAEAQRRYLDYTTWKDGAGAKNARAALYTILFGIGWSKQSFLHRAVTRDVFNRSTGRVEARKIVTANHSTQTIGHPFDVMWEPAAITLETARYVVWRTISNVKQVQANRRRKVRNRHGIDEWCGRYENTDKVRSSSLSAGRLHTGDLGNETVPLPQHVSERLKGDGPVEILEIMDRETDSLIVLANRQVVLRATRLPFWHGDLPVAAAVTTPDVGRLQGIAEVEWMKGIQEQLWLMENQGLDNTRLQMDLVLLIRDTVEDFDDFTFEPGAKWAVQSPDDVTALQYPQPQTASMDVLEGLRSRMQAVGGTAFMTGGDAGGMGVNQETASGLQSIIEEGNRRVDFRLNLMRSMFYERIAQQHVSNAAQYLEDTLWVPGGTNEDPMPVSPDDLAANTFVKCDLMSESGMRSMRQNMAQTLAQVGAQLVGTPIPTKDGMKQFNPYPIIDALAQSYDRDTEEFLSDVQAAAPAAMPGAPG